MSEETPEISVEQQVVAAEVPQVSETPVEQSPVEKKALEMGWDPNHQGKTFVTAEEYVNRAPLFDRIERQSRELKELKNLQKQMADHMSAVRNESYAKALQDLENKKFDAVATGNVEQYRMIESEEEKIKYTLQNDPLAHPVPTKIEPPSEAIEWAQKNNHWYNKETTENQKMMAAAEAVDTYLTNQARIDQGVSGSQLPYLNVKEHLKAVEKEVKRLYPHRFENSNRDQPASVAKSTTGSSGNVVSSALVSKLTSQQRQLGEKFQKTNPEYTLEKYAADLHAMGRIK